MGISLCRCRIGVPEEAADDFKAEAARDEVGCMSMPVVMKPVTADPSLRQYRPPEFLDVLQGLPLDVSGE